MIYSKLLLRKRQQVQYNTNKTILRIMHTQPNLEEDEDQIITIIKSIASEILTDDDFPFGENNYPRLQLLQFSSAQSQTIKQSCKKPVEKKYVLYTQRGQSERDQCQSEWIDYHDFEGVNVQHIKNKCNPQIAQPQNQSKSNPTSPITNTPKQTNSQIAKKGKKSPKKPSSTNNKNEDLKQQQLKQKQKQKQRKIKIQQLQQYGFMKPKSKATKELVINDVYKKEQEKLQENGRVKKSFKTLEELYAEKQPLYDKYLKEKEKKMHAIYESRLNQQLKYEVVDPIPKINRNIAVDGNFEQRLKTAPKKSSQQKARILHQVLQQIPFKPITNKSKKYVNIESVIKNQWKSEQSKISIEQVKKQRKQKQIKVISKVKVKDNSKSNSNSKSNIALKNNKQIQSIYRHDLKLNGMSQLSHILELDDYLQ